MENLIPHGYAVLSVLFVSALSLVGVSFLWLHERTLHRISFLLVSLAVGSLFGDAFIHLLPEAFETGDGNAVSTAIIAGLIIFFIFEKFLHWQHEHTPSHTHPVGTMSLLADGLHNFMDGVVIGAAYLTSPTIGFATTIAVIFHEIPQEIGEFGILLRAGFSRTQALFFNALSACLAFAGLGLAIMLGNSLADFTHLMLAFTAGGFIYIAGSDLIPELHRDPESKDSIWELVAILIGIGIMFLLTFLG